MFVIIRSLRGPSLSHSSVCALARKMYHVEAAVPSSQNKYDAANVDFRSDTMTMPNKAMREAMANAEVGDAVFGEDPTVSALEERVSHMLGKEAGLYVPSGTMSNLIGVMAHCDQRGQEVILGDKSHVFIYEQGGLAQIGGIHPRTVRNNDDGTFDLEDLERAIRPRTDPHQPLTRVVCLENTHNNTGGKVIPLDFIREVRRVADENNLILHLDGARLMNAAVAQNVDIRDISQYFDSISICFSKGIGAPVGSMLVGSQDLISLGVRIRKVLGGGMRQVGILAAGAMFALNDCRDRMKLDHQHAQMIAKSIVGMNSRVLTIDPSGVHTNILLTQVKKQNLTAQQIVDRLNRVTPEEEEVLRSATRVRSLAWSKTSIRFVTHSQISTESVERAIKKIQYVIREMDT